MSPIKTVLGKFNKKAGVTGSLVCSREGMLVDVEISERFDPEAISAYVSSVVLILSHACKAVEFGGFSRYGITATKGELVITDLGNALFVVLAERVPDAGALNVEIFQAANEIKKIGQFG